jgi:transposase-like protein
MERLQHSKYTKELRLETLRLVTEGGLSVQEASVRLSKPKSTLESLIADRPQFLSCTLSYTR